MLETNFLHKKCGKDLTFAMMTKTVVTSFGGGPRGQKPRHSGYFEV